MRTHSPLPCCVTPGVNEAGVDEAGRGCLAGPVFAAAVILPDGYTHPLLNDSKQLSEPIRRRLRTEIEHDAVAWAVASCSPAEIDDVNILNASILAMHRALDVLGITPGAVAVDGNRFKPWREGTPWITVVKGDGKYANIAAASILAKTYRDEYMERLHEEYPAYGWEKNKGYPTRDHRAAITSEGPTPYHRMTFRLLDTQLTLPF